MNLTQNIADFLRDGQYRIAQLSTEMDEMEDDGSNQYRDKFYKRLLIGTLMDILYEGMWSIDSDGYNHIQYGSTSTTWTDFSMSREIEFVRYFTNMSEVPYITFTVHYPQIIQLITGTGGSGSGAEFPTGNPGDSLFYDISGNVYADSFDPYAGCGDTELIADYFNR